MIKEIIIDKKNYKENGSVFKRKAVRAVVKRGGKYLIIHSKYGDHKFPGGGMEEGEERLDTLCREVKEETGFQVIKESVGDYILVHEKRKGAFDDLVDMDSWYYLCEVEETAGERKLDAYEKEFDYQVSWMELSEIIKKNEAITDKSKIPWIEREIIVMKELL